jgi:hypothetical protein
VRPQPESRLRCWSETLRLRFKRLGDAKPNGHYLCHRIDFFDIYHVKCKLLLELVTRTCHPSEFPNEAGKTRMRSVGYGNRSQRWIWGNHHSTDCISSLSSGVCLDHARSLPLLRCRRCIIGSWRNPLQCPHGCNMYIPTCFVAFGLPEGRHGLPRSSQSDQGHRPLARAHGLDCYGLRAPPGA